MSEADFSNADIRGTNFSNAILKEARFIGARAGVQRRWLLIQQLFALLVSALSGALAAFTGVLIASLFLTTSADRQAFFLAGCAVLGLMGIVSFAIVRQGFTFRAFTTIAVAFAVAGVVAVAGAYAGAYAGAVAVAVAFAVAYAGAVAFAVAVAGAGAVTVAVAGAVVVAFAVAVAGTVASTVAGVVILLSLYVAWRTTKGDEKFAVVRTIGVALGALGGTSFCGADLTGANFSKAMLKGTNFNSTRQPKTNLLHTCWHEAKGLEKARVGDSILANPPVRDLLVTRYGYKKSYVNANFRGANLNGVNLREANLKRADLSEATLHNADLREADLTETLALGTDFAGANLTGACLEAWNVDHSTNLEGVDCQHVYLLRNQQERRPSSGDFAPGEFTKLFQEVLSTVDLIFRNGIDWKAFVTAFQQVQVENEDTPLEIQSIENKGDGVVVVRVKVPPDTDKEKIHSEFNQEYSFALKALEARYQAELQAKEGDIAYYRQINADMLGAINSLANRPIHVQAIAEAKAMHESTDRSQNFKTGGDFTINATNSVVTLRDISGRVSNTINQLPDNSSPDRPNLKQLLTELKAAIESETNLPDTDKADLLEQVQNLAQAEQTPEPAQKEGLARKAKKIFDATLTGLPATATIVEACSKLFPLILKALGLPV